MRSFMFVCLFFFSFVFGESHSSLLKTSPLATNNGHWIVGRVVLRDVPANAFILKYLHGVFTC